MTILGFPTARSRRWRHGAFAVVLVLPVAAPASQSPNPSPIAEPVFAGAPLTRERAARIALDAEAVLIDARPCPQGSGQCALLAVRGEDGAATVYRISAERCEPRAANKPRRKTETAGCFGGYAVESVIAGHGGRGGRGGGKSGSPASAAKISAKPGEDGAPPDPQDEAQAEANNEIIEALADGKYDDNLDQFWADLESIHTWDNPQWEEPDPPPPDTIEGRPLPDALDDCRPERRALERNESKCDEPPLNPIGGSLCTADMIPSFTPATDNLVISNWDWELGTFVYFDNQHPNPTPEDVDLLVASWNFLVDNADIAEWVICLVEGPANGRCIDKRLDGRTTQPYEFVDKLPIGCPKNAGMCTAFIGHKTSIKLSSWKRERDVFYEPGQDDTEKLCVVARLASVLLHEMLHSCLAAFTQNADDFGVGPGECGCDTPDMAEAAFASAIAERFPCLANSDGCDFYGDEEMWLTPCDFGYDNPP